MENQTMPAASPNPPSTEIKPKKSGFFRKLFFTLCILAAIIILGLGYLGFMPGVSKLFGSDKPRNLGVVAGTEDRQAAMDKLGIEYLSLTGAAPFSLSGQKNFNGSLTDKELTALMAEHEKLWKYYPVSSAQVRFNEDGTAEVSGILRTDRIFEYAAATGIDVKQVKEWMDKTKIPLNNPPFYLKGKATVESGKLSGELMKVEIGRLPLPLSLIAPDQSDAVSFGQNRLSKAGVKVDEASIEAGKVNLKATLPAQVGFSK
jgi:hypothetical protein